MIEIKKWVEKHTSLVLTIILAFIIVLIGFYIHWTMVDTLKNHPEITEIETFAPPRLDLMAVTVGIISLICWLALKFGKPDDE